MNCYRRKSKGMATQIVYIDNRTDIKIANSQIATGNSGSTTIDGSCSEYPPRDDEALLLYLYRLLPEPLKKRLLSLAAKMAGWRDAK